MSYRTAYPVPASLPEPELGPDADREDRQAGTPTDADPGGAPDASARGRLYRMAVRAAWILAPALPLVGLVSLLLRPELDPEWSSARLHLVLFGAVGASSFVLASLTGKAAERRGDARVFLLSLAFLVTGGFLAVHAVGTPGVLLNDDLPGFMIAIPVGLLIASLFALASAFVDVAPGLSAAVVRHRMSLRNSVIAAMAVWIGCTLLELPPLAGATTEGSGNLLRVLAALGAVIYAVSAIRYATTYRRQMTLLPASVVACLALLSESLVGSALVGERTWHASWWEWHILIVTAFATVVFAARRQWHEERFHLLYLPSTREHPETVSVLFADLVGSTTFAEANPTGEVARMLSTYYEMATPLISMEFGGEVEKFIGDAIVATFNSHGDQPDHAVRAAGAGLELQRRLGVLAASHPGWPPMRVGVNSGEVVVREMGGPGHITYAVVGDTMNVGSRLETMAPVGGVLIGAETFRRLPPRAVVDHHPGITVKGKRAPIDAFVLHELP